MGELVENIGATSKYPLKFLEDCYFGLSRSADCLPLESHTYFNLGDLVTIIALLVAIYQLRNFRWDIGLKINHFINKLILGLIIGGSASIIISYIAPQLPLDFGAYAYQGLLQFLGFLMLFGSVIAYWKVGNFKTIFTKDPIGYVDQLYIRLAQGNPKDLDDIVQTIDGDLEDIFRALNGKISEKAESAASQLFILIFSDHSIVEFLAHKRLDFLCRLLYGMKRSQRTGLGSFPELMMDALLSDSKSHLFSLLSGQGVYHGFNLYDLLFSEEYFHGQYRVLNWVFRRRKNVDLVDLAEVQIKILETSCRAVLVGKVSFGSIESALGEFHGFYGYAIGLCRDLNRELSYDERSSIERVIGKIEFFLGHGLPYIYSSCREKGLLSAHESKALIDETRLVSHGKIYAQNLLGQLGLSILDFWEALSYVKDQDSVGWYREHALFAGEQVLMSSNIIPNLNQTFLRALLHRTKGNVENGHYPALTRIALILFGQGGLGENQGIRKPYLQYIYTELVPRIQVMRTMANQKDFMEDALVNSYYTRFNNTSGKLEHRGGDDKWSNIEA